MKILMIPSAYALVALGVLACAAETGANKGPVGMGGAGAGGVGGGAPVAGMNASPVSMGAVGAQMPCAVSTVVQAKCAGCHAATPLFGSRMPLLNQADFHRPLVSDPTRKVYERALELISATQGLRMPPPPSAALAQPDLDVMLAWFSNGARVSTEVCAGAGVGGVGGAAGMMAGEGGLGPVGGLGGEGGVGGVGGTAPVEGDVTCYNFLANAGNGEGKYAVGTANDAYHNFFFQAPWTTTAYARSFKTLTDNAEVVHHWLMFKEGGPALNAGTNGVSGGVHPGGELVHGWAPGGEDLIFPADVGFEMPAVGYTLELHYNSSNPVAEDASGLEICVTTTPPANIASLSWLGTDALGGTTASGTCVPFGGERIKILGGTPHMHVKGRHMKVEINRLGGLKEIIHDEVFDFNFQTAYPFDFWLEPGESITTTCTYSAPAQFGEGTNDEMCYFFTLAYPRLALRDNLPFGALAHGVNACIGM
jgi:hypothetical protein